MNRFIVAEATKNWVRGEIMPKRILSQEFELLIERNLQLGYRLHSFQFFQMMTCHDPETMTETLIAVFERMDADDRATSPDATLDPEAAAR